MALSAIGNFQLLSQTYNYNEHRIDCTFQVLPTRVTLFGSKATNDYYWMDAARWRAVEAALWREFEKLDRWEDAKKMQVVLKIDHINVCIRADEISHAATESLLAGDKLVPAADLCLTIQLEYITGEDAVIFNSLVTAGETKNEIATTSGSKAKRADSELQPKSLFPENSTNTEPILILDSDDEAEDDFSWIFATRNKTPPSSTQNEGELKTTGLESESTTGFMSPSKANSIINWALSCRETNMEKEESRGKSEKEPLERNLEGNSLTALEALLMKLNEEVPPPQVEVLLLESMTLDDVMASFDRYKDDIAKLFNEQKDKGHIHSYKGVSHIEVLDILNPTIHHEMMLKLAEYFKTRHTNASLIINGLLPLWIVLLFVDTYKLSHDDAVRHIKAQMKWTIHQGALDAKSEDYDF
ncbi:hypothetical protein KR200_003932 [Drosophila serrata]|nr:hypothetical protein KR200_003932 [Drosophila serrata]